MIVYEALMAFRVVNYLQFKKSFAIALQII